MSSYDVIRIEDSAWRIQEESVRSFLFAGEERALLVDSGFHLDNMRQIVSALTDKPVTLINTHTDVDHIACNHQFASARMSPAEYHFYHRIQGRNGTVEPLWEGELLDLGGRIFEVIFTPGHTSGSISLLDRENKILVGGDGVQDGVIFMFGEGRDLLAYQHSLERLKRLSGDFDVVYPSHGSFPVKSEILDGLLKGVKAIRGGKIQGTPTSYAGTPICEYDMTVAKLLLDRN